MGRGFEPLRGHFIIKHLPNKTVGAFLFGRALVEQSPQNTSKQPNTKQTIGTFRFFQDACFSLKSDPIIILLVTIVV